MTVIDVDSHVTEPIDLWTSRVSDKWGDLVPHVAWSDVSPQGDGKGEYAWFIGDTKVAPAYGSAYTGFDGQFPEYARTQDEAHPAAWDPVERLKVMDESGITRQALYGNVGGFGSEGFLKLGDDELMIRCLEAYNDFIIDFTSVAPERFIPICVAPIWDVDLAVKEVQRCVANGHLGVSFSGAPQEFGRPPLVAPYWEPLWSAIEDCGTPLSFHIGSGDMSKSLNVEQVAMEGMTVMYARLTGDLFLEIGKQLNSLLFSGILVRHPDLKFVCAESGVGWVPFVLDCADYHFRRAGVRADHPEFAELPSFYFRRQCAVTYWFEDVVPGVFERVGIDNVLFETDFPHPTGLWREEVAEHIDRGLSGLSAADQEKILRSNAERVYNLT
jgi:predicted TIM-barrel fold metal-dependent hydrolase